MTRKKCQQQFIKPKDINMLVLPLGLISGEYFGLHTSKTKLDMGTGAYKYAPAKSNYGLAAEWRNHQNQKICESSIAAWRKQDVQLQILRPEMRDEFILILRHYV
ncbi:unnamed protein product [Ceratitis capitata]|uniref:(Mediterranean fruit fly) hypothetical protein n=1 Tax=Ceratitis capitata TaxID=7213 RepID=A0A811U073_CERCA|nr:unnamed protein product [Ceratitis capitata]